MIDLVWSFISSCVTGVWNVFGALFDRLGAWSFYISLVVMLLLYRFLLRPLIGGSGSFGVSRSDKAKKAQPDNDGGDGGDDE